MPVILGDALFHPCYSDSPENLSHCVTGWANSVRKYVHIPIASSLNNQSFACCNIAEKKPRSCRMEVQEEQRSPSSKICSNSNLTLFLSLSLSLCTLVWSQWYCRSPPLYVLSLFPGVVVTLAHSLVYIQQSSNWRFWMEVLGKKARMENGGRLKKDLEVECFWMIRLPASSQWMLRSLALI